MDITDYTTYEDVRATLGVNDMELEDNTLALEVYSLGLQENLNEISPDLESTYRDIKTSDEENRSPEETRVYRLTRLYATLSVARLLSPALPMFSPKSLSDGKATMSRFSGEPYEKVLKRIAEQHDLYRGRLEAALEDLTSSITSPIEFTALRTVGIAYDPVTGE